MPAVILGAVLGVVFVLGFMLNKKTPIPAGCEDIIKEASCTGCHDLSCGHHPTHKEELS